MYFELSLAISRTITTNAIECSLGVADNVIISVGEDDSKQDFNVPEFFAVKPSQFMQTTLGGDWKESHEKRISPPKARVSDFEMYLEWLYAGQVVLLDRTRGRGVILVEMYLLGDFLIDDQFCNAVTEILIRESGATDQLVLVSSEDVDSVRSETTPGST